jgi:hypothetical protein
MDPGSNSTSVQACMATFRQIKAQADQSFEGRQSGDGIETARQTRHRNALVCVTAISHSTITLGYRISGSQRSGLLYRAVVSAIMPIVACDAASREEAGTHRGIKSTDAYSLYAFNNRGALALRLYRLAEIPFPTTQHSFIFCSSFAISLFIFRFQSLP